MRGLSLLVLVILLLCLLPPTLASTKIELLNGDARSSYEKPEIIAYANREIKPQEGVNIAYSNGTLYVDQNDFIGLIALLEKDQWVEAKYNDENINIIGVQFRGDANDGWARVLVDGVEVWSGDTCGGPYDLSQSKFIKYLKISDLVLGPHTIKVENIGISGSTDKGIHVHIFFFGFGNTSEQQAEASQYDLNGSWKMIAHKILNNINYTYNFDLNVQQAGNQITGTMTRIDGKEPVDNIKGKVYPDGRVEFTRLRPNSWTQFYSGKIIDSEKIRSLNGNFRHTCTQKDPCESTHTGGWYATTSTYITTVTTTKDGASGTQQNSMSWICQGNRLYNEGKYSEALSSYEKALEIDSNSLLALKCKGWTLQTMGRPEDAIESYEKVIEKDPTDYYACINKGGAFYDQGKYKEAIEYYKKATDLDPLNPYAWNARGAATGYQGNHEEALKYYEKALELDPNYCLALNNEANSLIALGRNADAQAAIDKAKNLGKEGCKNYGGLPAMDASCTSMVPKVGLESDLSKNHPPIVTPGSSVNINTPAYEDLYPHNNECNNPMEIGPILRSDDGRTAYFEIKVINPLAIQSIDICAKNGKIDFLDQVKEDRSYRMLLDDLTRVFEFATKKLIKGTIGVANKELAEYSGLVLKGAEIHIESTSKPENREKCRTLTNPNGIYGVRIVGDSTGDVLSANIKVWSNSMYCGQDINRYSKNHDISSASNAFLVSESIRETSAPRIKIEGLCEYCTECWNRPPIKVSKIFRSSDGKIAYFVIKEIDSGGPAIQRIRISTINGLIDYAYQIENKGRNEFANAMGEILFELASILNPLASPAKLAGEIVHERFTPEPTDNSKLDLLEPSGTYIVKLKARNDGEDPEAELEVSQMAPYCSGGYIEWKEKKPVYYSDSLEPFLQGSE